jgi:hypothetical protein
MEKGQGENSPLLSKAALYFHLIISFLVRRSRQEGNLLLPPLNFFSAVFFYLCGFHFIYKLKPL